ncbi:putative UPF0598 protein C8orf82-like protein [Hypsibius exemplaris]|uniref:UPF0598 protein C8orf82-like protein n=1 Tax=Hypsibius exemplaris TaxID=2072580 RepID=A0A1W0WKG1_HYPEX|nr:putative UPF0598 protein C8orf82-like protein [Hypsibius exemplaris]
MAVPLGRICMRRTSKLRVCRSAISLSVSVRKSSANSPAVSYVQGQSPEPKIREYFYFIDHEGQLFLDDAKIKNFTSCYKEKAFLKFFIPRISPNELHPPRYPEFPFISPCGRERNFIRCDDRPIVFTELIHSTGEGSDRLCYNGVGDLLSVDFQPELLSMDPQTGRVYYPAPTADLGAGLVKSSLAIELSRCFEYEDTDENKPPRWINWKGTRLALKR